MTAPEAVSDELASMLSSCTVCRLWAEQDDGPYHRAAQSLRRDVVEDRDGVALQLGIRLERDRGMPPREATVEIRQCDALGRYSGFPPPDSARIRTRATAPPYAERPGRDTFNATDEIFPTGGDPAILDFGPARNGYRAAICLVVPTTETVP